MTNEDPQPISALWQNEFNVDNLIDYARASKDLSDYIRVLVKEGYPAPPGPLPHDRFVMRRAGFPSGSHF